MGRNTRTNPTSSAAAVASGSGSRSGNRPSNTGANLPSAITQARYVAEKCLQDAFEGVQAVPIEAFSAADQQLVDKSEACRDAMEIM
jgi:hypothetical protein